VTVAPVTTRIRQIPAEVPLGPEDGLHQLCVVNLDTILTIAKASLREHLATLSAEKIEAVEAAIRFALAME
jgi:mRNA interferase MazF